MTLKRGEGNGGEMSVKFEKGDHVVFKCTNPATGWVVRVARDGTWADVEWNGCRNQRWVRRTETKHLLKTNPIFNKIMTDPVARVFMEVS